METLTFTKINFDNKTTNDFIENFYNKNNIEKNSLLNVQLVNEEFLSNILFPNYDKDADFYISKEDEGIILSYSYEGDNYMKQINDRTILSLKLLQSKTKGILSKNKGNKTIITFVI